MKTLGLIVLLLSATAFGQWRRVVIGPPSLSSGTFSAGLVVSGTTSDGYGIDMRNAGSFPIVYEGSGGTATGWRYTAGGLLQWQIGGAVVFSLGGTQFDAPSLPIHTGSRFHTDYGIKLGTGSDVFLAAVPTISAFGGTGASITGTHVAFDINVGTGAPGNTGTITFGVTASTGWYCDCYNFTTTTAVNRIRSNGGSTTTCQIAQVSVAANAAVNWAASDHVRCTAIAIGAP